MKSESTFLDVITFKFSHADYGKKNVDRFMSPVMRGVGNGKLFSTGMPVRHDVHKFNFRAIISRKEESDKRRDEMLCDDVKNDISNLVVFKLARS